jgi:hypothetical protein
MVVTLHASHAAAEPFCRYVLAALVTM